ncbi:MAG: hypothetical protein AAGK25_04360, partial [Pseudomonadota bacterium]
LMLAIVAIFYHTTTQKDRPVQMITTGGERFFLTLEPSIEKYRIDQAASKADRQQLANELHAAVNKAVINPY